jgi:hypothetical protein
VPCDRTTIRCRTAKDYHADTASCCRGHIRDMLAYLAELLPSLGVTWWMDYGTLLGAVRHQGMIPHDKDGDIGVMGDGFQAILDYRPDVPWSKVESGFRETYARDVDGYHWVHKPARNVGNPKASRYLWSAGHSIKVRLSAINHTNVDIFPWYLEADGKYHRKRYIACDRYKGREIPAKRLLPLTTLPYEDLMIPAPADPEWLCQHRYGARWRIPLRRNNDGIAR